MNNEKPITTTVSTLSPDRQKVLAQHITGTPVPDRPALIAAFAANGAPADEIAYLKEVASSQPQPVRPKRPATK